MRTVIRLLFLLSAFAVGAQDSALVDTNGVLVHPTNFLSANGIAPLASPALSGNPTAPTATAGDNDTSISTTAFVTAAIEALKALQLWQDTNAVLTTLAALTGGNSSNFFKGTGAFAQVTTNDIPNLVTMLGGLQPLDADLTSIAGLTWTDTNTFLRGDKTLGRDGQNWTNLNASQLLIGTVPMGRLALGSTNSSAGLSSYWTDGTNRWTSRDGQGLTNLPSANLSGTISTGALPGLLGSLSTGNGGGVLTNAASPSYILLTNWSTSTTLATNITIPSWCRVVVIECLGGGGSGASGMVGAAGTVRSGGSGGAGGSFSTRKFQKSSFWSNNLYCSVSPIAIGAAGQTTNSTPGIAGASGASTFVYIGNASSATNLILRAVGGGGGVGGDSDGSSGGAPGSFGMWPGGSGGASSSTGGVGTSPTTIYSPAGRGGGAGGGISTGDVPAAGGVGMYNNAAGSGSHLSGGAINGAAVPSWATSLTAYDYGVFGGHGAAGSGGATNIVSAAGGSGEFVGSGGGGSGGGLNGFGSGPGGNGGSGAISISFL